jgi:hypothetical protein
MALPAGPEGTWHRGAVHEDDTARLRAEFLSVRRVVEEAQLRVYSLRMHTVNTRLAERLEEDVRRVIEDLEELARDTLDRTPPRRLGVTSGWWSQESPVPVPPRMGEPVLHTECGDEGGGSRQLGSRPAGPAHLWRHTQP